MVQGGDANQPRSTKAPNRVRRLARGFADDRRGAVAIIFGLVSTVLLGLVGGGIDFARLAARRNLLQGAVDAGTLAGGSALKLALSNTAAVSSVAEQTIRSEAKSPPDRPLTVVVTVASDKTNVAATASENFKLTFGSFVGLSAVKIAVKAQASVVGRMRLCMLALDPLAMGAFNLQKAAQVTANGCSLYSNSVNAFGMVGGASSIAKADTICSAGGYSGARANFMPTPQAGCPVIEDPLKGRANSTVGACSGLPFPFNLLPLNKIPTIDQSITLDPGTYCGGLQIKKNAVVTLKPGIFVFKDGPLIVKDSATLTGIDVGLFFAGEQSGLLFDKKTTVSLAAPTTGEMAGLLMAEQTTVTNPLDPAILANLLDIGVSIPLTPAPLGLTKPLRTYRIISDNARTMLGTIYLPAGRLVIDSTKPVADQSAYTVIVAQQINLYEGPNLVLNANYAGTSVPVPKGVGPISGRLLLTQ
ncbi:pilus assembly protein [Methylobacterium sp. WL103]|uniref:TadE/TadG family type IV pilus assembly protein n=1 Tax=Methylobacterium sp. WL103 TaxID=2603891 RepID=UPI0011C8C449|nr:TadE/TadG family type IV pilus assembly protein [Methylobacterium sp. WL103]TXN08559.1 pilus assembly protein [Methylobacterium sp. WL103]